MRYNSVDEVREALKNARKLSSGKYNQIRLAAINYKQKERERLTKAQKNKDEKTARDALEGIVEVGRILSSASSRRMSIIVT